MLPGRRYERGPLRKRRGRAVGLGVCSLLFLGALAWLFRQQVLSSQHLLSSLRRSGAGTQSSRRAQVAPGELDTDESYSDIVTEAPATRDADVATINTALSEAAEGRADGGSEGDATSTRSEGINTAVEAVGDAATASHAEAAAAETEDHATEAASTASEPDEPASARTVAQGIGADDFPKLVASSAAWTGRPVPQSDSVAACSRELEEQDKVPAPRDFDASPIRVYSSEVRIWQDCGVRCQFSTDESGAYDATLAGGEGRGLKVLRSMEAAAYYRQNNVHSAKAAGYDVVMTVHYDSDVPVQYGSWEEYRLMRALEPKDPSLGLAAAFISNCAATNFRLQALDAIQKYIKVDSYGRCNHNMGDGGVDKQETLMKYKFSLAFENSCEPDYVTEKFWQSLVAGAVPIVVGAPNIHQFAPNNHSFFHIKTIEDVPAVAEQVKAVASDEEAWKRMVDWKWNGPSDFFQANMDISTVHSSCRLCIFTADKIVEKADSPQRRTRPCRCQVGSGGSFVYHFYVRERFWFKYTSIYLESSELSLAGLTKAIQKAFSEMNYQPVWAKKRPPTLATEDVVKALRVFRIYPSGLNQRDALQGDKWLQNDEQLLHHVASNPCPDLEVIFV